MRLHIVGPAGVGKSAVAWQTAQTLRIPMISIGGVLRAVAGSGLHGPDEASRLHITPAFPHEHRPQRVHIGDQELTLDETNLCAEAAAATLGRRPWADVVFQRIATALPGNAVCEGRPCPRLMRPGDHVVRLTASSEERSRRLQQDKHRSFSGTPGAWLAVRDDRDAELDAIALHDLGVHYHHVQTDGWNRPRTVAVVVDLARNAIAARKPSVSVVIPARDSAPTVIPLVQYLVRCPDRPQIVVADDGSSDGTAEVLRRLPVTVVSTAEPHTGRSAARNAALARTTGDIVVFLDADVRPRPGFLSRAIRVHEQYPGAMVIGPRDHTTDLDDPPTGPPRLDSREALLDRYGYDLRLLRHPWLLAYTCNLSVPGAAARELRFDESLRGWGLEDADFALRLSRAGGYGIAVFDSDRRVWHRKHAATTRTEQRRYAEWSANAQVLARRHGTQVAAALGELAAVFDPRRRTGYLDAYRGIEGAPPDAHRRFLPRARLAEAARLNMDQPEPVFPEAA
ncbi:glycosyltransferase [Actinoplanes sp. NEAU-A12]|uniref:(d)CMP kinase n=1 Tax=Actinoplanes sandaracinus TaxID=3045177 RepID=A0ABT6WRB3_9ACTN|nr:glycosyltransferase [Actinoplanes sandaracinus]MDI6102281.1 glycosyltransferase [Actinoplanes sandaracinus]